MKGFYKVRRILVFLLVFGFCAGEFSPAVIGNVRADAAVLINQLAAGGSAAAKAFQLAKSYEEKLAEAEERKAELEKKKQAVAAQIRENEQKKEDLLDYIAELDMQIMALNDEIEDLEGQIVLAEAELETTKEDLSQAQETEAAQYEAMKRRIQYMYENGGEGIWSLLLGATSLSEILNRVEYQKEITEYDKELLVKYTQAKQAVEQHKQLLEAELASLGVLKETAEFNRTTLTQLAADKSAEIEVYLAQLELDAETFADYAEEITREEANIETIKEEERKRIEEEERRRKEEEAKRAAEEAERKRKAEAAAAAAKAAAAKAESESDAKRLAAADNVVVKDEKNPDNMIWPLPGDGRIYAYFGPRVAPTKGASTYHRGLDIGGVYGARIVATLSGKVIEATYNASRGNYVAIDHGGGLVTYYMHCSKLLVSAGDEVLQGSVVALVGSTGISTGPHVHYSVAVNGNYVDPLKYVSYK